MKNWLNNLFILCTLSLVLFACEKDEERVIVKSGTAPALTASSNKLVLEEAKAGNEAVTLNWSASDFSYKAAVNYTLQFDLKGNNFAAPAEMVVGGGLLQKKLTVGELNTLLNRLPVAAFKENAVEVRVKASVSNLVEPAYSNVTEITVTPYLTEPPYATLYMIGDATDAGWDNTKAIAMLRDPNDLFKFTFTGNFNAGNLKFLGKRGSWAPMYGAGTGNALAFRETEADADPASIQMTAGYKTVTVDLRNNTYSVTAYDASAKPTYPNIGIIGSFSGWGTDVLMNKTANNPHYWTLEHTFTTDVEMKFRLAGDWGTNWGAPAGEQEKLFNRTGGDNLKIPAGTYLIVFNDLTSNYIFIKKP